MRSFLLSSIVAALCLALPLPSFAQDASDCGMMCRITGYLSSDHMTADPSDAASAAPSKPHKPHAAASHKGAKPAVAVKAASTTVATPPKPAPPAQIAARPARDTHAAEASPALTARPGSAGSPPRTAVPVKAASGRSVVPKMVAKPAVPPTSPMLADTAPQAAAPPAAVASRPKRLAVRLARAAPVKPVAGVRATRVAAAHQTVTASALIPGSAPTMPAGFQPFGWSSVR